MSETTKIEWADMTFNPWRGCEKVSPGCKFCYAERQAKRNPAVLGQWGRGRISVRGAESYLRLPAKWEKLAAQGRFVQCEVCGKREFRRDSFAGCSDLSCLSAGSTDSITVRGAESYLRLPAKWEKLAAQGRFVQCEGCGKREFRKWDCTYPAGGLSCCSNPDCLSPTQSDSKPVRPRVFCLSFGDWLDEKVPIEWLVELLETIRTTPHLDWLLLTKRPGNWLPILQWIWTARTGRHDDTVPFQRFIDGWLRGDAPKNVWVGTSVEDQIRADERIPELLRIPAHRRFLSCEPLLGAVNLRSNRGGTRWLGGQRGCKGQHHGKGTPDCPEELHHHHDDTCKPGIDWVIAGGESESKDKARPFALEWALDLQQQCASAGVPFFLKQLGTAPYVENANLWDWPIDEDLVYTDLPPSLNCPAAAAIGVKLRHKKGGDREEWPDQLQAREFPKG